MRTLVPIIFVVINIFCHSSLAAGSQSCSALFSSRSGSQNSLIEIEALETIKSRLSLKAIKELDFDMLRLPTVSEIRKWKKSGLSEDFIDAVESNSLRESSEIIVPIEGRGTSKFVRVYRLISFKDKLENFDINHNYKNGNPLFDWEGDFVTHIPSWTWVYGGGRGKDILLQYLVPAKLLDIDQSMMKQEPYYVISKKKMNALGIENVWVFVERVATVEPYKFEDPSWQPDPRFFDDSPMMINNPPKSLSDPRIKWLPTDKILEVIRKGF